MQELLFNGTTLLLCLFGILAIAGFSLARYSASRMRTVPEGHIAVVQWMDRFSRVVGPGPYWLRPLEAEIVQVYVRQREASAAIPNIFTDGGLGVNVNIRYAYRLDPQQMATDELYYTESERKSQQEMLIREVLLDLVQELGAASNAASNTESAQVATKPLEDLERLDVVALFSPFAGSKEAVLRSSIKDRVSQALLAHGIVITNAPVQIAGLGLSPEISAAYGEYVKARFSGSARSEFIRRVRAAAPNMSEAGLVQLLNIIQNPSADIQTIFTTGMVNQEMLVGRQGSIVQQRIDDAAPTQVTTQPPQEAPAKQASVLPVTLPMAAPREDPTADDVEAEQDYPLVESDNTWLKSPRGEPT